MGWKKSTSYYDVVLCLLVLAVILSQAYCIAHHHHDNLIEDQKQTYYTTNPTLYVNVSSGRLIPQDFYGIFFEEINHAGAGGLWAELVSNRGFEAGGRHSPSMISPWGVVGDENSIFITTELSSCFKTNLVALQMVVKCDSTTCPPGGVGVYNPGYWGMNIEQGKTYKVVFYVRSSGPLDVMVSFVTHADGASNLAFGHITAEAEKVQNWTKMEVMLRATGSNPNSRLQITTSQTGTIWLDQVSAMPTDTYNHHGFRNDLMNKLIDLKPRFLRFPGGCYVEGAWLSNAFRWKETIGPWEYRPGHLGDVWGYWSDDGLGYLEYLQLAEDLGAEPVWVINSGQSIGRDEVDTTLIGPFVREMLDSIEFARGNETSRWGSLRAKLGHPTPFSLKYVAIGNEDCGKATYRENYLKFYYALKGAYPDIQAISNCDATKLPLDHPADLFDFHDYTNVEGMLGLTHLFDKARPGDPKAAKAVAFVSEYAVTEPKWEVANGTFGAALAEAAFLLSLEDHSDVVGMVSYAPLFEHENDRRWSPDAIIFNSHQVYGTPSYWVQTFFKQTSGAFLLNSYLDDNPSHRIYASAINWMDTEQNMNYITVKVVNYQNISVKLNISLTEVDPTFIQLSNQTVITADDLDAQNTFDDPQKVVPQTNPMEGWVMGNNIEVDLQPFSFTAFDLINKAQSTKQ